MSRYRLYPTPEQEAVLVEYCSHTRYVWNLAWELNQFGTLETYGKADRRVRRDGAIHIHQKRRPVRPRPNIYAQCKMLTEARAEYEWLAAGSAMIQQIALRDFDQAMQCFYGGTHRLPKVRKRGQREGFGVAGIRGHHWDARRLSRHVGEVRIPKLGWVRFRWSCPVPADAKSYRITLDRAGRWHVCFTAIPQSIIPPGAGEIVGVDRGVKITAALSTGEQLHCPGLSVKERARLRKARRRMDKSPKGSPEREAARARMGRLRAREIDRRKNWCEEVSTDLARRFDVIRFEDLKIRNMTRSARGTAESPGRGVHQKAGLNRVILAQGWAMLVKRTERKAPGRVEKVRAAYTSLRCSDCGWIDKNSRESQAGFCCTNCGFTCNADINAAINIAAGHAGGAPPSAREPLTSAA